MAYLELKNITKKYDDLIAVNQLDFSVEKNEFAVLFGSSAAGKTTTLRCISGLEKIETCFLHTVITVNGKPSVFPAHSITVFTVYFFTEDESLCVFQCSMRPSVEA